MGYTSTEQVDELLQRVRATFKTGKTKDKGWRRQQLKKLWWMLEDHRNDILKALHSDLHKHAFEALPEVSTVQHDVLHTLKNLDAWTADQHPARSDLINFLGRATVRMEALGNALIIGAWNYPFALLLQPLVAAIAAGCTVVLKPSDVAQASLDLMLDLVPRYLDSSAIVCVSAGPTEMGYLLAQKFDQIFYTGSPNVARIISTAAAKNLTPTVLELGGQGPAIVCKSANIDLAAKRIAATKFMNAGQICLNVNHVFVDPTVLNQFVDAVRRYLQKFSGESTQGADYYSHIINERNFDRLSSLLDSTTGMVALGGNKDRSSRFFAPTVVTNVTKADSLLSEELFGPILPIIEAEFETAIEMINEFDHPLGLYTFTSDPAEKKRVLEATASGGVTFNDCVLHAAVADAPFGGVGNSGSGYYHGPYGIRAFSYLRTCIDLPNWMDKLMGFRYPPYTLENTKTANRQESPWFDREGNDTSSLWTTQRFVLAFALLGVGWASFKVRSIPTLTRYGLP